MQGYLFRDLDCCGVNGDTEWLLGMLRRPTTGRLAEGGGGCIFGHLEGREVEVGVKSTMGK